ncbi:MAG: tetratricopeptide repeat protein, partial [Anaeromyxobacteraceae bacterium]
MSAPLEDEKARGLLEALDAVPGDERSFAELAGIYEAAGRYDELVALHERGARMAPAPGVAVDHLSAAART